MGDENPIRTLGDYSKPSHEGYKNTIELLVRNNVNDPRDFAKPVKAITLPQDVPSTFDRRLIELENQVQRLMEAHLAPTQPTQVNKITTSCKICNGPHNTQYCMEDPEQAFIEYVSSRTDEAGGLVSNFMASQNARLSMFEADFKRQQGEMTNKIYTVLKAITDQIAGTLPSDTVKNLKLGSHPVSPARSYPTMDPQYELLHKGVTFRLGGVEREMSLLELEWRVGLYSERESRNPATLNGLRGPEMIGVIIELHEGECCWLDTRGVKEGGKVDDEGVKKKEESIGVGARRGYLLQLS
ncbi:hypothetical protein Tco_1142483 [Tanacetum coccineum]